VYCGLCGLKPLSETPGGGVCVDGAYCGGLELRTSLGLWYYSFYGLGSVGTLIRIYATS